MKIDRYVVSHFALQSGFSPEALEKALHLLSLLDALHRHPYLRGRLALKGGTALNLFLAPLPRLSVDIDLHYVGAEDRETMETERPLLERAIEAVCSREGLAVRRIPADHAGGKWRMNYIASDGRSGNLELDLNLLLRVPLWPLSLMSAQPMGDLPVVSFPILDRHELAAGKLVALVARGSARDLFDARTLHTLDLDDQRLRLAFVVLGGANRVDWREVATAGIHADPIDIRSNLLPMLRRSLVPEQPAIDCWTMELEEESRVLMGRVLPLLEQERVFLERLNGDGDIIPALLTADIDLQRRISVHPALRWKALNVRKWRAIT